MITLTAQTVEDIITEVLLTTEECRTYGLPDSTEGADIPEDIEATLTRLEAEGALVVVRGARNNFVFDRGRLEAYRATVTAMLEDLPEEFRAGGGSGGWSFLNLCMTKDGEQWTGLHRTQEALCALAIGLGIGAWLLPRAVWINLPGGVPYFVWGSPEEIAEIDRDRTAMEQAFLTAEEVRASMVQAAEETNGRPHP